MVKSSVLSTAIVAVALTATQFNSVEAFQSSPLAVSSHGFRIPVTQIGGARRTTTSKSTIRMTSSASSGRSERLSPSTHNSSSSTKSSLFQTTLAQKSQVVVKVLQKLRRTFTIAIASFAFLLASTRVHPPQIAHASTAIATRTTTTTTISLARKLNPFRTRSVDELIDNYVRERLFADDEYDPVESAYREVYSDASSMGEGSATGGAYPSLLAETAGAALGRKDVSSLVAPRSPSTRDGARGMDASGSSSGKGDGITANLMRTSDFLQKRLGVSASVSYYMIAAGGLVGICVVPAGVGVLYQGLQRLQIDKSEMKMYGKITDIDATAKKKSDDDDDDDEAE